MPLKRKGLIKLVEESGELQQIIGKNLIGKKNTLPKLEEEIADVMASAIFVIDKLNLDKKRIYNRIDIKLDKLNNTQNKLIIDVESGLILS